MRRVLRLIGSLQEAMVDLAVGHPKAVVLGAVLITIVLGALITRADIDTDPENMLRTNDPARVLNRSIQEDFGTNEMIVLGVIDEGGVLTPEVLTKTGALVDHIKSLDGVVSESVVSFKSAIDVPEGDLTSMDVDRIVEAVDQDPLLAGQVISADRQGLAVYIPLISKGDAEGVSSAIKARLDAPGLLGTERYFVAGLPLAEEIFGSDIFIQMALLAPLAGLVIFLLMLYFFRRLTLVIAAMAVAMMSVIWTMGLLIGTGFTLHIMSSMIPIFLMPIAILDSIHVLSEFFDRYPREQDRQATLRTVYKELFTPITYTHPSRQWWPLHRCPWPLFRRCRYLAFSSPSGCLPPGC